MQIRSWSRLLMIVSIAIAVFPVWRSPMINSRWPRPIGIIESIAFSPVCIGSFTGWRWITPGALNSAGRVSEVLTSPLSSSGRPSGSTRRPSSSSPTGISSSRAVRLTVSPSTILSQSPKSTAPTLSSSRFSARPITSCGSSSISSAMQLSRPWTRAMPSPISSTVPTSERSAAPASIPLMRSLRMLPISSGLISIWVRLPFLRRRGDVLSQFLQAVSEAGVEHHVADLHHQPAEDVVVDFAPQDDTLPGLLLDLIADLLGHTLVELDGAGHGHLELAVLPRPELLELPPDAEDHRHPVLLVEQLQEVDQLGVGALDRTPHPLALLRRGEVRTEQEDLQVAAVGDRVGELSQLLADRIELSLLLGRAEERLGIYAGDLFHRYSPASPFPDRDEKSTSARASSTRRFWSSESRALRVTFS